MDQTDYAESATIKAGAGMTLAPLNACFGASVSGI